MIILLIEGATADQHLGDTLIPLQGIMKTRLLLVGTIPIHHQQQEATTILLAEDTVGQARPHRMDILNQLQEDNWLHKIAII